MAIKLIATYSKKLGLPGFSSHSFSVTIETELITTEGIASESQRIYQLLQSNVDEQIQTTGFVPPKEYGMDVQEPGNVIPHQQTGSANLSPTIPSGSWLHGPPWQCSERQKNLILKLVDEHHLPKSKVEESALASFGKGVTRLNKAEASAFIDALLKIPKGAVTHGVVTSLDQPTSEQAQAKKSAA